MLSFVDNLGGRIPRRPEAERAGDLLARYGVARRRKNVNADRDPSASSLAMLKRRQTPPENCYKEGSRETHWEES